ncbi:MAG: ATP-binding cassette domain-containing protein [Candidatus Odyssella sp.]|nr:ATP-binding cassette domain-containing protein [Candidatus Odyssella sp.]
MSAPILETRGLTKRFGGVPAVDGVDFKLGEGELRCLIGPNGAGKSTFFKMITGQLAPTAGTVLFRGADVTGEERHRLARHGIGIKTQVPSLFDGLDVRESLHLAARRFHGASDARRIVDAILAETHLDAVAGRKVGELAHGQRQWVELGMVLAREPLLLLLDEPTAGMTPDETRRTAALIARLRQRRAMIVVEHDMHFVRMIAEAVTVFHQGRILMEAPIGEVLRDARVREVYLGAHKDRHA